MKNLIKFTPENITELKENEIIVIGTNLAGIHGAGAAKFAHKRFGLKLGFGEGLDENSKCYAFPTKDEDIETLPLHVIKDKVLNLYSCAASNPNKIFLLTKVGCGLAGYKCEEIAEQFRNHKYIPENIIFPREFAEIIWNNYFQDKEQQDFIDLVEKLKYE